jgi:exopolysaccharide biosynthesis polyprenyl glycosylphosphotransferase
VNSFAHSTPILRNAAPAAWLAPRRLLVSLDSFSASAAYLVAYALLPYRDVYEPRARLAHGLTLLAIALLVLVLLFRDGQYSSHRRLARLADTVSLSRSLLIAYLVVMGASYATGGFFTGYGSQSRAIVFGDLAVLFVLMLAARLAVRRYQLGLFSRGEAVRRVLVVGSGEAAAEFTHFLEKRPWLGIRCAGSVSARLEDGEGAEASGASPLQRLGDLTQAKRLFREQKADEFVLALDAPEQHLLPAVAHALRGEGLPFRIVPSLFECTYQNTCLLDYAEVPTIELAVDPLDRAQGAFKRACDLLVAGLALVVASPMLLVIAGFIKATSPGPVIFSQERVGRNGRPFKLHKFRTMYIDAETRLQELLEQNEAQGPMFKMKEDPRITRLGRLLRRTSLDEFPQFFNVLFGEMSVVGPRPPLVREVEQYQTEHLCRLKGRPGITGLWQVSGRSALSFEQMVQLDRHYLENWSISLDLQIIAKTFWVVLARDGAY